MLLQAVTLWPLAGVVGLLVGSFVNVIAWRWYREKLPRPLALKTRSQCPECGKVLGWHELIPLVSFAMQRGRCRHCSKRLSWRYPIVELLTASIFAVIVATYGLHPQSAFLLILASNFLVVALVDTETQLIPDQLSVAGLVVSGLGLLSLRLPNLISQSPEYVSVFSLGVVGAVIGVALLGFIVLVTKGRGMGIGDIKLGGVLGLSLGGPATLLALFVAFVSGAAFGLTLLLRGKASMKTAVPFGPFLIVGWLVAVLWGQQLIAWYTGF